MKETLKVAVIGVGYLGRFHAQKYAVLPHCELIGVIDSSLERAKEVGEELNVPYYQNYEDILEKVDAVSIVVPTVYHYAIAKPFLQRGKHVLLEKPFAATVPEAKALLQLAEENKVCLQIGHLERFNVVFTEFQKLIQAPRYIENIRIAPFPKRGTDVDVVLDLMIHDIDLVLAVVGEYPSSVEGFGVSILTPTTDIANARLRFPNGCIADLTASRISDKAERKMRIFQSGLYLSLDYGTGKAKKLTVSPHSKLTPDDLKPETYQLAKADALLTEIQSFLAAIQNNEEPEVTALDGLQALEVAWEIKNQLTSNL
ncbi:Gfo/Idh/MocA family oxidoreductase [Deltaproteobacteria bacterium TL4]